jgi:hypothetical protein
LIWINDSRLRACPGSRRPGGLTGRIATGPAASDQLLKPEQFGALVSPIAL